MQVVAINVFQTLQMQLISCTFFDCQLIVIFFPLSITNGISEINYVFQLFISYFFNSEGKLCVLVLTQRIIAVL